MPWLGLTELKVDRSGRPQCDFRLSKGQYSYYFTADLFLFYATPLVVALVVYSKIVTVLRKSVVTYKRESCRKRVKHMSSFSGEGQGELVEMTDCMVARDVDGKTTKEILTLAVEACEIRKTPDALNGQDAEQRMRGRTHVRNFYENELESLRRKSIVKGDKPKNQVWWFSQSNPVDRSKRGAAS